ncbi:MAG: MBOAT family protein, partial [Oscillospiraceae bacterium]|nr:MBOAT family protein [Oscillospiraceae bacterium]
SPERSVLFTWLYLIAYSLHIYYDFSGYSDMAIGIGRIFGFRFLENFNYPYTAQSVTDFWRRWHISLSTWFRDYVYIPLGGNRTKRARYIFNIFAVWLLTGLWHGAGWTFIAWGAFFGVMLLLEKFFLGGVLTRLPRPLRHIYVLLLVFVSWTFFDAPTIAAALSRLGDMLGATAKNLAGGESLYYLRSYLVPLIIAAIGATPLPKRLLALFDSNPSGKALAVMEPCAVAILLIGVTAFLVDGSFNPFIYFRF